MSEIITEASAEPVAHDHPSDWDYIKTALLLGAITAVEVFTYFKSVLDWGDFLIPALMVMMVVKFWLVTRRFMHLRFDNNIYSAMFVGGIMLALGVYMITLGVFEFWA